MEFPSTRAMISLPELNCAHRLSWDLLLAANRGIGGELRMSDIRLGRDEQGGDLAAITIRNIKTDKFDECDFKTLKSAEGGLCTAKAVGRLITSKQRPSHSEEKAFGSCILYRLDAMLRMDGAAVGAQALGMGNHSLRPGGATAMWRAGYEVEIVKRWGRWESESPQGYLLGDYRIMSTI